MLWCKNRKKSWTLLAAVLCLAFGLLIPGCSRENNETAGNSAESVSNEENRTDTSSGTESGTEGAYTLDTKVEEVMEDPVFGDYGRLIFPVDRTIDEDLTLRDVGDILTWYNNVNPDRTVEIANYLREQAQSGEQIFYDIYTDEEKEEDPDKENTGLFFFRGNPREKFAITNAGGGFAYVAAMHDSFPHAMELSEKGYNAFAPIYRPGARMAAWIGSYGTAAFGEEDYPAPAAVIMQYTGLSDVTGDEPPTYACVGTNDGIADYRTVQSYINQISDQGTDTEIEVFEGLSHGFGLGEGTVAEGWIDRAVSFWERNMNQNAGGEE